MAVRKSSFTPLSKLWPIELIFVKLKLTTQSFIKNSYTKLTSNGLNADHMTDRRTTRGNIRRRDEIGLHRTLFNPLNPELNPICYLLALLGAYHFLHVCRIRVKLLTFRRLMSYTYGAPILDVSRSHTTMQHSR
jgi:hypothetical protein